jgi:hypothetical protein
MTGASGHDRRMLWLPIMKTLSVSKWRAIALTVSISLQRFGPVSARSRGYPCSTREVSHDRLDGKTSCRPPDTTSQPDIAKVDSIGDNERRRQAQTRRFLVATRQTTTYGRRRKVKEIGPFANERIASALQRTSIERNLCPFDHGGVATDRPRNKPMDHQLGGIVHLLLINPNSHGPFYTSGTWKGAPQTKIQLPGHGKRISLALSLLQRMATGQGFASTQAIVLLK